MRTVTAIMAPPASKARQAFLRDVLEGLQGHPKRLQSKYFYDATGDALFQQIMHCAEYYLTRCEMEILETQSAAIVATIRAVVPQADLVELGAGDASKSVHLLREWMRAGMGHRYYPIDISGNIIRHLQNKLPDVLPGLEVHGLNGEYMEMLAQSGQTAGKPRLVMFMGSSIGNFTPEEATGFLSEVRRQLRPGDFLLTGFDLQKNPRLILDAYNDKQGLTRNFNLNLLTRINRELDADFLTQQFLHYPTYDPGTGACKSYLISLRDQAVHIGGTVVRFRKDEPIYMEISQKYTPEGILQLAASCGFTPIRNFTDEKGWFTDALWQAK
ncbi:L-histidine N(alpha)-methyltransferase [Chitinophaga deserti]|uniref:L-histidine N(alpha)-methyltransferase n=1 Tax=Chitinophaga deserti TaxID=2164099 RepID=UPI000D6D2E95|nr:L-histidine N(alpha)-methyltransferase [Chitinophaga deserti]